MGPDLGLTSTSAAVAAVVEHLTATAPNASVLDQVGRVASTIIDRRELAVDPASTPVPLDGAPISLPPELVCPEAVGLIYEQLLSGVIRQRTGAHFTAPDLAGRLISAVTSDWDAPAEGAVLDPSCGGGAFIVAAARHLSASGLDPDAVAASIAGIDVAPDAVAVSQLALALWLAEQRDGSVDVDEVGRFEVADALIVPWPKCRLVVGNPPFLSQLGSETALTRAERAALRERFGEVLGPYTDLAWLFLYLAADALVEGGRAILIQPTSLLSARDGAAIRQHLLDECDVVGMWVAGERVFAAAVDVWAPVLEAHSGEGGRAASQVRLWRGAEVNLAHDQPTLNQSRAEGDTAWSQLSADAAGVPSVVLSRDSRTVGDLATVTAGFRDQFYGFVPFTAEEDPQIVDYRKYPQLVTVGMIDPLRLRWGTRPFRFAGKKWSRPVVDVERLRAADPSLGGWLGDRLRPKVLMATQTNVLEVVVDSQGSMVPITPCLSIEPRSTDPDKLWLLAAALTAPALTVAAKRAAMGAALSANAIKVSAKFVASLPLPSDGDPDWTVAAIEARRAHSSTTETEWRQRLGVLVDAMAASYDLKGEAPTVNSWWWKHCPRWR